jgi:Family of unknown function (DUF6788)
VLKGIPACRRKISALMKEVYQKTEMLQGSLVEKFVRCGKDNCRCANGTGHGPVYYLSFKEKGVTRLIYIRKNEVGKVRKQISKFKRYKKIGGEISRINRDILKLNRKD